MSETRTNKGENGTEGRRPKGLKSKVKTSSYDLSGRRVNKVSHKGIYVVDGKKIVKQ
jgi:hypothetical protein